MILKEKAANKNVEILIVEDDPTHSKKLSYLHEHHGYRPSVASNGVEALLFLENHHPALVISDILMPEMDGFELCRHIRADQKIKDLPVILLTSLSDPRDAIEGLKCGADNFIIKPFRKQFLLSRIEHVLINRELRKEGISDVVAKIIFAGQTHLILSNPFRIIELLLSIYENAVQKNRELLLANEELNKTKVDGFVKSQKSSIYLK